MGKEVFEGRGDRQDLITRHRDRPGAIYKPMQVFYRSSHPKEYIEHTFELCLVTRRGACGSMNDMAKDKVTITLDRAKAAAARDVVGVDSTSEVIDIALDRLLRAERLRTDILAYQQMPPTQSEMDLAGLADTSGLADDTDWEALYPETPYSDA